MSGGEGEGRGKSESGGASGGEQVPGGKEGREYLQQRLKKHQLWTQRWFWEDALLTGKGYGVAVLRVRVEVLMLASESSSSSRSSGSGCWVVGSGLGLFALTLLPTHPGVTEAFELSPQDCPWEDLEEASLHDHVLR